MNLCRTIRQFGSVLLLLIANGAFAAQTCHHLIGLTSRIELLDSSVNFTFSDDLSILENLKNFSRLTYGLDFRPTDQPKFNFVRSFFSSTKFLAGTYYEGGVSGIKVEKFGVRSNGGIIVSSKKIEMKFPNLDALGEKWQDGEQSFQLFNFGSRQIGKYAEPNSSVSSIAEVELAAHPNKTIVIPFSNSWLQARTWINTFQAAATRRAIENYKEKKPYIQQKALDVLEISDGLAKANNDFLALTKDTGKSPIEMTPEEFKENLLLIIRLARSTYFDNSVNDTMAAGAPWMGLPFFSRVPESKRLLLKHFIDQISHGGKLSIAEVSRFNRFGEFSEAVMNKFLLRVFQIFTEPGAQVDLILIETDRFTSKLFRKYGFVRIARLSEDNAEMPEYLMAMDTRSDKFREVFRALIEGSNHVQVMP